MDSFTSPPTLPEVGLDGLVSEITIISSVILVHFHHYYTDLSHMGKNTSLRPSSVLDFISSSLTGERLQALKAFAFSCKNQPGGLE